MTVVPNGKLQKQDYKFETLLGQGTFGQVFLVRRRKDGKQFVIKHQAERSINDPNGLLSKIIRAEVQCLRILRHPNVVSYYGAWQEDGNFYILMEYAVRGTLKDLLDESSAPLTDTDALYLFAQMVLGVHHIHTKNILHRDLKPENIMLTGRKGDIVKIGDFGLSRHFQADNKSHAGTYYYIAPEMLKKEFYDFKSDVWSLGVILYEMLTKEHVFPAETVNEMIDMICKQPMKLFNNVQVVRETKIIVYKMLQREPAKRPSTKLLLLNPRLINHVAKVYLNLGRCYAVNSEAFNLDLFQPFFNKLLI